MGVFTDPITPSGTENNNSVEKQKPAETGGTKDGEKKLPDFGGQNNVTPPQVDL